MRAANAAANGKAARRSEKAEASLAFGGTCPLDPEKTVAMRIVPEPLAGCVERSVLGALREPASSLIDSSLFTFHADEFASAYDDWTLSRLRRAVRTYDPAGVIAFAQSLDW